MMNRALFVIVSILFVQCQRSDGTDSKDKEKEAQINQINVIDEDGLKQGLWVDTLHSRYIIHNYYLNDTLDGEYKRYLGEHIDIEGYFSKGARVGSWYYYDKGELVVEESAIQNVVDSEKYFQPFKSYSKSYYRKNGKVKDEGWLLWTDDFMEDGARQDGEWIYYDENGSIKEVRYYDRGKKIPWTCYI